MVNSSERLQATFAALADPVRRQVIERLSRGEETVSNLAADHDMSLPGFLKHLRALEEASLVTTRKEGRVRTCVLQADTLADAADWLNRHRIFSSEAPPRVLVKEGVVRIQPQRPKSSRLV